MHLTKVIYVLELQIGAIKMVIRRIGKDIEEAKASGNTFLMQSYEAMLEERTDFLKQLETSIEILNRYDPINLQFKEI